MTTKRFSALLVTSFPTIQGMRFTEASIKSIFQNPQYNIPVTINFGGTVVGAVKRFDHTPAGVVCTFDIDPKGEPMTDRAYLVPGLDNVQSHMEGHVRVIDGGDLTEVSISLLPQDQHLTPIRPVKKGE